MSRLEKRALPPLENVRVAFVAAKWNLIITQPLLEGAHSVWHEAGLSENQMETIWVPGSFELPLACKWLAESQRFQAMVAIGVILEGETPHFDLIAREATRGIAGVMQHTGIPIGLGLVVCHQLEQALARAGGKFGNKGSEAAYAALEMLKLSHFCRTVWAT
jgi:6,7-dimethyl-8-ribityllumazine synthase